MVILVLITTWTHNNNDRMQYIGNFTFKMHSKFKYATVEIFQCNHFIAYCIVNIIFRDLIRLSKKLNFITLMIISN